MPLTQETSGARSLLAGKGRALCFIVAVAVMGTLVQYQPTLDCGFMYDDFHQVRPYPASELWRSFHNDWDVLGLEFPYYRPLTVVFYAARQWLCGYEGSLHHWVGLSLFIFSACLTGVFLLLGSGSSGLARDGGDSRENGSQKLARGQPNLEAGVFQPQAPRPRLQLGLALLGTAMFVGHAAMPAAGSVWISAQYQLLQMILLQAALIGWLLCRHRPEFACWSPLLLLQAACFLVKEDGVMLLPCVLAIHILDAILFKRPWSRWPPVEFLVAAGLELVGLVTARQYFLSDATRHILVGDLAGAVTNLSAGPTRVIGMMYDSGLPRLFAFLVSVSLCTLGMLAAARKRCDPGGKFWICCGLVVLCAFNLPYVAASKKSQYHLLAFGHVILMVGSLELLLRDLPWRTVKPALVAWSLVGLVAMNLQLRGEIEQFAPTSLQVQKADQFSKAWLGVMAPEMRKLLLERMARNAGAQPPQPSPGAPASAPPKP